MTSIVAVQEFQGEARADSRHLAARMENKHKSLMSLIDDYAEDFSRLGHLRFEMETVKNSVGAANKSRHALLNEDQCYFLLTLVRNSDATVPMKRELVQAFGEYRRRVALAPAPILPTDPLELLELSLRGMKQTREEVRVLQATTAALEVRLDNTPIAMHPEMEATIYALCQELARVIPGGYSAAYRAFKSKFGEAGLPLAKYTSLPARRFPEGCGYLRGLIAQHSQDGRLIEARA
ncbi:Rha family transcriptional regulator [Deinococcus marmoris]|uniref:Phage-encoded protein n=1 Tax=Deinococcus marmoris TaxID=249408 RepID=A0A1U7P4S8_9DEIO|nr:Rha family transcriptional regulator [Deinococcus marmoris]OLV20173.1 phage-encoded protein [Deinococcus marmoris]